MEVHPQSKLSILAACEDPTTVGSFTWGGEDWPLPQTGQMWLERYLLDHPESPGFFCVSTSYRNEPSPMPGRHDTIFPMFEFEAPGNFDDLMDLEISLCSHLGLHNPFIIPYEDAVAQWGVDEISAREEHLLGQKYGPAVLLYDFPEESHPFWNMKRDEHGRAKKVDVLIDGVETIGSAERSSNPSEMRDSFYGISDGGYAKLLYNKFGEARVEDELMEFLGLGFFPRYGGGIGITRLIRGLNNLGLL